MPRRQERFLSGLGAAEAHVLGWEDVLGTAAAALPVLIEKLPEAVHAYETHGGGAAGARAVIPIFAAEPEPASAPAPARGPAPPVWYESPGFLVVTGLAVGLLVAVVRKEK